MEKNSEPQAGEKVSLHDDVEKVSAIITGRTNRFYTSKNYKE